MSSESRFIGDLIDELIKPFGFSRKRHGWYRTTDDVISVVALDKSDWGKLYSINVGVVVRRIHDAPPTHFNECHVWIELGLRSTSTPSLREALDFENSTLPLDQRREHILSALLNEGLTFFTDFGTTAEIHRSLRDYQRYGGLWIAWEIYENFRLMGSKSRGDFIARTMNEVLFPRGYERKKRCWYFTGDETTSRVELKWGDHGSSEYCVNVGVVLRSLVDARYPEAGQCHISTQFSLVYDCGPELRCALDDTDFPEDKRKTLLVETLESRVLKFREAFGSRAGIRKSLLELREPRLIVEECVREAFGLACDG